MTEDQILDALKIQPTDARRQVLNILMERMEIEFTIRDICNEKELRKLSFTKTSVIQAIRLFQVRGFIIQSGEKKSPRRGRPTLLFRIASGFFEAAKTAACK
jgi:Fe2+ or Zn2+ uptake regulation protein